MHKSPESEPEIAALSSHWNLVIFPASLILPILFLARGCQKLSFSFKLHGKWWDFLSFEIALGQRAQPHIVMWENFKIFSPVVVISQTISLVSQKRLSSEARISLFIEINHAIQ